MLQNTQEWLDLRRTKIGASDANIIMGVSKFSTVKELLEVKKGIDKPRENHFITDRGHKLEEKIRSFIEIETGLDFPALIAFSEEHPFLMASLDGYNEETKTTLECKYVGIDDFNLVRAEKFLPQYYPQMQMQMLVTGSKKNILAVARMDKEKNIFYAKTEVKRDDDYIRNDLLPKLLDFWTLMNDEQNIIEVKLDYKDKLDMSDNDNLVKLLNDYQVLNDEVEKLTINLSDIKDKIFSSIEHDKVICGNATIQKIKVKGRETIDYKKFVADNKLTVPASYTKIGKPSETRKISFR